MITNEWDLFTETTVDENNMKLRIRVWLWSSSLYRFYKKATLGIPFGTHGQNSKWML